MELYCGAQHRCYLNFILVLIQYYFQMDALSLFLDFNVIYISFAEFLMVSVLSIHP